MTYAVFSLPYTACFSASASETKSIDRERLCVAAKLAACGLTEEALLTAISSRSMYSKGRFELVATLSLQTMIFLPAGEAKYRSRSSRVRPAVSG